MPFVFIFVFGFVCGFAAALVYRRALKDAERAQKARIASKDRTDDEEFL